MQILQVKKQKHKKGRYQIIKIEVNEIVKGPILTRDNNTFPRFPEKLTQESRMKKEKKMLLTICIDASNHLECYYNM